jgi:fibronectin-binding autotransporter adhesin
MADINTKFMIGIGASVVALRTRWTAISVVALAIFAVQASPARVYAQSRTWASNGSTQSGTSVWSGTSNWIGGVVPNAPDVTATFTNTTLTYAGLTGNTTIGNLTRSAGSNSSSTRLVITGTDTGLANQGSSIYELTFATTTGTAPAITAVGRTDVVVRISGSQGFTKAGTGDLYLWGLNTYTGTTTISAGKLRPQGSNLGTTADGTVVLPAGTLLLDNGVTITGEPLFISGTGNFGGSLRANATSEYAGPITATGSANITANAGATLTLSGLINPNSYQLNLGDGGNYLVSGGFVGTSGTVSFTGPGAITLSGSSSFTRTTSFVNSTGLVTMTGYMAGLMDFSPGGARTLAGTGTFNGGLRMTGLNATLAPGASDALTDYGTITTTTLNLIDGIVKLGIQDATTYDRLVMTAGSGGLTLAGANKPQLTLDFANTITSGTLDLFSFTDLSGTFQGVTSTGMYAGTWANSGGTNLMWSLDTVGALGSISATTTRMLFTEATGDLTFAPLPVNISGTTVTFANGGTVANPLLISTGSAQVATTFLGSTTFSGTVAVGGAVDLSAVAGGTAAFTGVISGGGAVAKSGLGTVTLTAANTYAGNTAVNLGVLELGSGGALSTSSAIALSSGATLRVNRADSVTQGTDFSTAAITGAGGFTQAGAGTTTLNAANSYAGTTLVNAGKLLINGDQSSATGAVTVAAGATLGGSGTVGGNTTITGIHSPGNSPGIQTFNGNLTYETGAVVNWELIANSTGSAGTDYDQIVLPTTGNLTFNGSTTLALSFNGAGSAVDWSNTFWNVNRSWTVYDLSSGVVSNAGSLVIGGSLLDSIGNSLSPSGRGYFNTSVSGQDVMLNFVAVPEPSTIVLFGGSVAAACLMRRRRRETPDGTRNQPIHPSVAWSDK